MIKVRDIAHVRIRVPDLDQMETYLTDFGLQRAERTGDALYMRGTDPNHHCLIVEQGEAALVGVAFFADSADDLREISNSSDAGPVEKIDEPGGGSRVVLSDPNGFRVEVVHGIAPVDPLPVRSLEWNASETRQRVGHPLRLQPGPSSVKRLGHAVVMVRDVKESETWYRSHFGFLRSDAAYLDDPQNPITIFMRCDRGSEFVDHHTFLVVPPLTGNVGLQHMAFEVHDVNDIFLGHEYLRSKGYEHEGGIGRHILGSQVFDYWKGPYGFVTEHWTDGDLLDASYKSEPVTMDNVFGVQWGNPLGPPGPPPAE